MSGGARTQKDIILDTNGTAVARHGLKLSQNEATGSRKLSRYLPDLRDTIKTSKFEFPPEIRKIEKLIN